MARASWVGSMKILDGFELPLRLAPAAKAKEVELNMICLDHTSKVEQVFQCQEAGEYVERDDLGRAYVAGERVTVIPKEDLEALKDEEGQRIEILETRSIYDFDLAFVAATYRAWTDEPYQKPLASFRRALDRLNMVALGTMVVSKRKYLVALRATPRMGLTVMRLFWQDEVREEVPCSDERADTQMTKLFTDAVLGMQRKGHEPVCGSQTDSFHDRLIALIKANEKDTITESLEKIWGVKGA